MFTITSLIATNLPTSPVSADTFWDSPLGKILASAMGVVGIIVVVYAIIKAIKNITSGKIADAVKGIVAGIAVAAIMFQPTLINSSIKAGSKVMQQVIDTVASIGGSSSTPTTPSTPATTPPPAATTPPATTSNP